MQDGLILDKESLERAGVSSLFMFGDARHKSALPLLPPHRNPGVEICLCRSGVYEWEVEGDRVRIRPGELSVTRPWQLHSGYRNLIGPGRLNWVIVDATGGPGRLSFGSGLSGAMASPDLAWTERVIGTTAGSGIGTIREAAGLFDTMEAELGSVHRGSGSLVLSALVHLVILVARALERGPVIEGAVESAPPGLLSMLREVAASPFEAWTTASMAERAGFGTTALVEWCKRLTGRSPRWYLIECRLEFSRKLLETTDGSITTIALDAGFSSSQHFAAAFRRLYGLTPTDYRAMFR